MEGYNSISPYELGSNPFKLIGKDWMLITAGTPDSFNTMTASWGGLGVLWNKEVCTVYVRPSRYTFEFIERENFFTLSFFEETHRKALNLCGTKSGRDIDKVKVTGLTPVKTPKGSVSFSEAVTVIECAKLYSQDMDPSRFLESFIEKNYNGKDYHRFYIGEIVNILTRQTK